MNAVWDVECKILDNGWSAEFRFPFSTFKFYNQENKYGVLTLSAEFAEKRNCALDFRWTKFGLDKNCRGGDLVGIENVQRGNPIYLKPYFTAGAQFINGDKKYIHEPGLM